MTPEFAPLLKDSPDAGGPPHAAAARFCPLVQTPKPSPTTQPAVTSSPSAEPTLTVQRTGERITQIQIRCTCGQVIELECDY